MSRTSLTLRDRFVDIDAYHRKAHHHSCGCNHDHQRHYSGTEPWLPALVYNAHVEARTSPRGALQLYERLDALQEFATAAAVAGQRTRAYTNRP